MSKKLFCEICPLTYKISRQKEIMKRHIKNTIGKTAFAKEKREDKLPIVDFEYSSQIIKTGKGIDITLQENKGVNLKIASSKINGIVVHPGETFSFWKLVGKVSKRKGYKNGRVITFDGLKPGLGGGLCNLGNTINLLVLHSPLEIVEFHTHSDALAPDHGKREPLSSGTSVDYNYIDYRFKNTLDQDVQVLVWCEDGKLKAQLRSEKEFPYYYEIIEEDHHFSKENNKYYRVSKIYRNTYEKETNKLINKELIIDNHSKVMFDYDLIPKELIR